VTNRLVGAAGMVLTVATLGGVALSMSHAGSGPEVGRARFTSDGSAIRPMGWRQWVHVGTRYKPIGLNILDQKLTKTPEILNAYVEPGALEAYERTGQWPEGTQIAKEFTVVQVGAGCNPKTVVCSTQFGDGIYESGFIGLGYMVKDAVRFPDQPGHWGYFSFGHQPPPYLPTAKSTTTCVACHVKLASDTDYVISKAHIGLDRSRQ
jgi:hypothetical protein